VPARFSLRGPLPEIARARRIAEVLARNGLGFVLELLGLSGFVPFWRTRRVGPDAQTSRLTVPERLRRTLEELGPTYIKLGQVLSTRPDILPPDIIIELSKLLDAAPPAPSDQITTVLEQELGAPVSVAFRSFTLEPIASASIGQVHEATLHDGTRVVVKVQRPGVERTVQTDLNILLAQARFLEARSHALRSYHIVDVIEEFAQAFRDELDYTREGRHADTLRELTDRDQVIVPKVYWEFTTRRVITLERIEGIKISRPDLLASAGYDLGNIARDLARMYLNQVFVHGVFHADPHPANILVAGHRLGLMDFGSVGYLSATLRDQLGDLLFGLAQQDADHMLYVIVRMGAVTGDTDRDSLRMAMQRLVAHYYGATLQSVPIAEFLGDIMGVALRHRVRLPADLALLVRTVVVLEGVARSLDPTFDLAEFIEPFARRLVQRRLSPRRVATETAKTLRELEQLMHVLPRRIDSVTEQLERGSLTVGFDLRNVPEGLRKLDNVANRLSFSIIVAALVVGSALILAAGPEVAFKLPFTSIALPIPQIGFVLAALMGAWLLFSIIRSRGL